MTVLRKRKIGKGASDMTKKILILSGSPRKQGNSDLLCAVEKGIIYGTGVYHAGEIKNTKCMQEAYEMGKNV